MTNPVEFYQGQHQRTYAIAIADSKDFQTLATHILARMSGYASKEELNGAWTFLREIEDFSKLKERAQEQRGLPPTLDHRFDQRKPQSETKAPEKK